MTDEATDRTALLTALTAEHAVLQAGQEDHRELEALRGVQRHQRDHTGRRAFILLRGVGDLVGVGDQGDPLEEVDESRWRSP